MVMVVGKDLERVVGCVVETGVIFRGTRGGSRDRQPQTRDRTTARRQQPGRGKVLLNHPRVPVSVPVGSGLRSLGTHTLRFPDGRPLQHSIRGRTCCLTRWSRDSTPNHWEVKGYYSRSLSSQHLFVERQLGQKTKKKENP